MNLQQMSLSRRFSAIMHINWISVYSSWIVFSYYLEFIMVVYVLDECPVSDTISVIDSKTARVASKTTMIITVSNVCTSEVLRTEPQHDVPLHAPLCFFRFCVADFI